MPILTLILLAAAQAIPAAGSAADINKAYERITERTQSEGWAHCAEADALIETRFKEAGKPIDKKLFPKFEDHKARIEAKLTDKAILQASVDSKTWAVVSSSLIIRRMREGAARPIGLSRDTIPGLTPRKFFSPSLVGFYKACGQWDGATSYKGAPYRI